MALRVVVAGGQTGVDQAALRAARRCGITVAGWCPPGRHCEDGEIPIEFPLVETPQERSPRASDVPRSQRTEWNVRDSGATLVVSRSDVARDAGTEWACDACAALDRPVRIVNVDASRAEEQTLEWMRAHAVEVLHVAGPAESTAPGIGAQVEALLMRVFRAFVP